MKLLECNVISGVCLSFIPSTGVPPHHALNLTIQGSFPGPSPGPSLYRNQPPALAPVQEPPLSQPPSPSPAVQDPRHGHDQYCLTWNSLFRDFLLTCSNVFKLDLIV